MLTEKQLLAAPEKDYMNAEQLDFFRQMLMTQRAEIQDNIDDARQNLAEIENNSDPADVATSQEIQQLDLRNMERQTKLLHKIEATIHLIESGDYGYCEVTGEPIGIPRLLARPTATLSIQAKEIQEHHERTEGKHNTES